MIRITCPGCGSKLNAKDELVGQTRKCPSAPTGLMPCRRYRSSLKRRQTACHSPSLPRRLNREHHYLICDRTQLVASWENNGRGWMLKSGHGLNQRQAEPRATCLPRATSSWSS